MSQIDARFRLDWPGFCLDVDLQLPGRGVTAFFGPSGSGKTSLLRCIAGLERAAQGQLTVAGDCWQDAQTWLPPHQRPIGYVFQEASLFPHLSVLGNLRYGMKRSPGARQESLDQAIALLGIEHLLARGPQKLSGGERQRVAIARALALNPRLLLMDEPLAALDLKRRRDILPYLETLHETLDIPILYVSHAPDEVARLADHLVLLEQGQVQASGPLQETLSRLDLPAQLGEEACVILPGEVAALDSTWHLVRVDFAGGSLWTSDQGLQPGQRVRLRINASDVSLASDPGTSSIQNILPGVVDSLQDDAHPGLLMVRLRLDSASGSSLVLARLTRRAASSLSLQPGQSLWVQVKSVALLE